MVNNAPENKYLLTYSLPISVISLLFSQHGVYSVGYSHYHHTSHNFCNHWHQGDSSPIKSHTLGSLIFAILTIIIRNGFNVQNCLEKVVEHIHRHFCVSYNKGLHSAANIAGWLSGFDTHYYTSNIFPGDRSSIYCMSSIGSGLDGISAELSCARAFSTPSKCSFHLFCTSCFLATFLNCSLHTYLFFIV